MKTFLYRYRYALSFNAIVVPTSFILMGWKWGVVNIFAAIIGTVIGVGLASMHEKEG